jgi:receptor expression-enhancing protein 5/6
MACSLAAFVVGLVFPTLESMKAIESHQTGDDKQWLTYWVCYSTLLSLETVAWSLLIWIPFYRLVRVGLMAWLSLPNFSGAAWVYDALVRPFLLALAEKACEVPALKDYFQGFLPDKAGPASTSAKILDAVKEQVTSSEGAEEDERAAYQPLKAHAQ